MTWSSPPTAAFQQAPPYTWWNTYIRDNLLETAPAKATTAGSHFASTGPNAIAERLFQESAVDTGETTTSTTYVSLATNGPVITATTGPLIMVWINCQHQNTAANGVCRTSIEISGATTTAAADARAIITSAAAADTASYGRAALMTVTPGSNTVRMLYRVSSGTGTFNFRRLQVMPL